MRYGPQSGTVLKTLFVERLFFLQQLRSLPQFGFTTLPDNGAVKRGSLTHCPLRHNIICLVDYFRLYQQHSQCVGFNSLRRILWLDLLSPTPQSFLVSLAGLRFKPMTFLVVNKRSHSTISFWSRVLALNRILHLECSTFCSATILTRPEGIGTRSGT